LSATLNPPSLAETINAKGFSHAAGFRIVAVEPGRAEVALTRRDDLVQFFGHFHGGVIAALADHAAGIAVTSGLPPGRIGVTVEIKITWPADGSERVRAPDRKCRGRSAARSKSSAKRYFQSLCAFTATGARLICQPSDDDQTPTSAVIAEADRAKVPFRISWCFVRKASYKIAHVA
jgi:uncharacterized protein (TIGR00369 family)